MSKQSMFPDIKRVVNDIFNAETIWISDPISHNINGLDRKEKVAIMARGFPMPIVSRVMLYNNATSRHNARQLDEMLEMDGAPVDVRLDAVCELPDGISAYIKGYMLDESRSVTFYDTRYPLNKGRYEIGKIYTFMLGALVDYIEVVKHPEIVLKGKDAYRFCSQHDEDPEFDEDGEAYVEIGTAGLVEFLDDNTKRPWYIQFQSPCFDEPKHISVDDADAVLMRIAIARDDDKYVYIPLIASESWFETEPRQGEPVRGVLILQGHLTDPLPQ